MPKLLSKIQKQPENPIKAYDWDQGRQTDGISTLSESGTSAFASKNYKSYHLSQIQNDTSLGLHFKIPSTDKSFSNNKIYKSFATKIIFSSMWH